LPPFYGKDNVEAYIDWVAKVEQLFDSHMVEEERRVSLAVLSFQGHALNWWTALVLQKRKKGLPEIEYWFDLKEVLHVRHVPSYYKRELMDKLQRLQQRNMTVEEYRQRMELYILRAGIDEVEDLTIARFLSGFNYNIRDKVELLPYRDLNELVQMSIKVEQQLLRKPFHKDFSPSFSKSDFQKKDSFHEKETTPRHQAKGHDRGATCKRGSEIKCFKCLGRGHITSQCPTKHTIVLKGQNLYSSQDESPEESHSSSDSHSDTSSKEKKSCICQRRFFFYDLEASQ